MAITYHNHNAVSNNPVAPCGMCRQSLLEYEIRQQQSFRLLLSGVEGNVIVIEKASMLLPLSFTKHDLL
jgi:cytidine deaminase